MKRLITVLAIVFLVFAFSSNSFAQSGSVTVQWGTIPNRGQTRVGTRKKEDLLLMLQHMATVQSTSTGTTPTATSIKNPAEGFIFT